jgi:6-phosphogluconolactonase
MTRPTIFNFETEEEFWKQAKDDVIMFIKETLSTYKTCRIGLSGGSTPEPLYAALADADIPWEKIILITIDERYVPSDHADSNLKMIRSSLTNKLKLAPNQLINFDTSLPIESAAREMERKLIQLTHERFPLFDLLILGAGADGHIASLFEGSDSLTCTNYASSTTAPSEHKISERLTLCLMALKQSKAALLLLKGEAKAGVLTALKGEANEPRLTALKELAEDIPVKVLYTP